MGMCENVTNCDLFMMDYLIRCITSPLCHFTFCWSKKIFFILYKITNVPYDSIHRVRLGHLLGLKIKIIGIQIFQKFI